MKTLDEVIKAYEICRQSISPFDEKCKECPYHEEDENGNWLGSYCGDCHFDALHYLRKYREQKETLKQAQEHTETFRQNFVQGLANIRRMEEDEKRNDPLDWETLKTMEGKPVWVDAGKFGSHWYLIEEICPNESIVCLGKFHETITLYHEDILTYWQAYRKERSS